MRANLVQHFLLASTFLNLCSPRSLQTTPQGCCLRICSIGEQPSYHSVVHQAFHFAAIPSSQRHKLLASLTNSALLTSLSIPHSKITRLPQRSQAIPNSPSHTNHPHSLHITLPQFPSPPHSISLKITVTHQAPNPNQCRYRIQHQQTHKDGIKYRPRPLVHQRKIYLINRVKRVKSTKIAYISTR